ncbi:MAG: hypothetical protein HQM09_22955 [Candidatus Riflebacteria bacterium]|nr:hypothetical protein [Candidatus Riflebacteria bacterium]
MKRIATVVLGLFLLSSVALQAKKNEERNREDRQDQQPQHDQRQQHDQQQQYMQSDRNHQAPENRSNEYRMQARRNNKISNEEKRVFGRYYTELVYEPPQEHQRVLPPGLAKKIHHGKALPPGWQRKLAVGEVMPEEIYYYARPLPVHIIECLPPQPEGTCLLAVSGKIVRLLQASMTIIDVLELRAKGE